MQIVCWSELSAENWKNKLSAGPFLQLSAGNPADEEAMIICPSSVDPKCCETWNIMWLHESESALL